MKISRWFDILFVAGKSLVKMNGRAGFGKPLGSNIRRRLEQSMNILLIILLLSLLVATGFARLKKNWVVFSSLISSLFSFAAFELRHHELPWEVQIEKGLESREDLWLATHLLNMPVYLAQFFAVVAICLSAYAIKKGARWPGGFVLLFSLLAFLNSIVID